MIKRMIIASVVVMAMATSALAFQCPGDMRKIDAKLASASLPDDVLAEVVMLRKRGQAEHGAGQHAASVATLADAMRLITENS